MPNDNSHFRQRETCEVCGCTESSTVLSRDFLHPSVLDFIKTYYGGRADTEMLKNARYEIAQCFACGFLWQKNILTDAGLKKLYEEWITPEASQKKRLDGDIDLFAGYAREMGYIRKFSNKAPRGIRVLDHGMGWGYWCRMAIAFGFQAAGTELSEVRRKNTRAMGVEIVDINALPNEHYDFVNSEQSFEHIPEPAKNLKKIVAALKQNGVVRIAVPDASGRMSSLGKVDWKAEKDAFHPLEHINSFTHKTLMRLGHEAGLTPVMRPFFPLFAWDPASLLRSFIAPVYYRTRGTILYFRKKN